MGLFDFIRQKRKIDGTEDNDNLRDSFRDDLIDAGSGDDLISLSYGDDEVFGRDGNDVVILRGNFEDYTVIPPENYNNPDGGAVPPEYRITTLEHPRYGTKYLSEVEYVEDSSGQRYRISDPYPSSIKGTEGNDILNDTPFDDYIFGYGGNDTILLSGGFDIVYGGEGEDTADIPGLLSEYEIQPFFNEDNELTAIQLINDEIANKFLDGIEIIRDDSGGVYHVDDMDFLG